MLQYITLVSRPRSQEWLWYFLTAWRWANHSPFQIGTSQGFYENSYRMLHHLKFY